MRLLALALLAAAILATGAARAESVSGNEIYKLCDGSVEDSLACTTYVTGAADALVFVDWFTEGERRFFCPPAAGKIGQIHDIFTRYLREHPEERHEQAIILLVLALAEAWPCH